MLKLCSPSVRVSTPVKSTTVCEAEVRLLISSSLVPLRVRFVPSVSVLPISTVPLNATLAPSASFRSALMVPPLKVA